jgi:hypothetical protein
LNQREAFLAQARSDFAVCEHLRAQDLAPCHWMHYLQMTTEKLAKAVRLSPAGGATFKHSHVAFSKLSAILRRQTVLAPTLHMETNSYREFIDQTSALRAGIEQLAPDVAGGRPNAEYPWEARDHSGQLRWWAPCDWTFPIEAEMRSPQGHALLKLITLLLRQYEQLF